MRLIKNTHHRRKHIRFQIKYYIYYKGRATRRDTF